MAIVRARRRGSLPHLRSRGVGQAAGWPSARPGSTCCAAVYDRAGLDARNFPWPPRDEPNRAPYRGLKALEPQDAAIFFGRDAAIVRGLDRIRGLVERGVEKLLVVLGASGSGNPRSCAPGCGRGSRAMTRHSCRCR